jgi:hypothetical protein
MAWPVMAALAVLAEGRGVNRLFFRRIGFMLWFVIAEAGSLGPGLDASAVTEEAAAAVISIANTETDFFRIRSAYNSIRLILHVLWWEIKEKNSGAWPGRNGPMMAIFGEMGVANFGFFLYTSGFTWFLKGLVNEERRG